MSGRTSLSALVTPILTALPPNPVDGQEIYFLADATNGVVWHLKYRAGSTSTYKWEYIGGPPLTLRDDTGASTTSTGFVYVGTQQFTLPLAGDYDFDFSSAGNTTATSAAGAVPYAGHALALGGTASPALTGYILAQPQAGMTQSQAAVGVRGTMLAGTICRPAFSVTSGGGTHTMNRIAASARPVRLG